MRFAFDLVLALATFFQENLRYVKEGQPVEVSLDLYPDQIFRGVVDRV
jgi:multidrug resistance efflux pump